MIDGALSIRYNRKPMARQLVVPAARLISVCRASEGFNSLRAY